MEPLLPLQILPRASLYPATLHLQIFSRHRPVPFPRIFSTLNPAQGSFVYQKDLRAIIGPQGRREKSSSRSRRWRSVQGSR